MRHEKPSKSQRVSSLLLDVEQNIGRGREWFARRIGNDAQREQRDPISSAGTRNELRFHIHGYRARRLRNSISFLPGIDHGRDSQKIGNMDREICEKIERPAQISSRQISREQEIADTQLIVKRACKSGADQTVELSILEKSCRPLPANFFPDTCMKDLDQMIVDLAGDRRDPIISTFTFVLKQTQKP